MHEYICPCCKNTNEEHLVGCTHNPPKEWKEPKMQITIPSPPITEYTFTTKTITADTSIGKIMIRDYDGEISLLFMTGTDRVVFIPDSATNVVTFTTTKNMKSR